MTSRERLDRCFRHLEIDRPGLFMRGLSASSPKHPSYQPAKDYIVAHGDLKWGWSGESLLDPVPTTVRAEGYSEDFERVSTVVHTPAGDLRTVHLVGLKGQPGMCEEHLLKTEQDAEKYLSLPARRVAGDAETFFELDRLAGDHGIVDVSLGINPAGLVADLFGSTRFAELTIENRGLLHALMVRRRDDMLDLAKELLARGIGPYFSTLGQEYVAPPLHGPEDFYEFNVQYDKPLGELIHDAGALLHVHCHGPLGTVLPAFIDIGADVLHPLEPPPMGDVTARQAKEVLRGHVCIEGNLQIGDMYTKTPNELREEVAALIRDAFDDHRGLIVCPSASPYVPEMPLVYFENVKAVTETVLGL